MEVSATFVDWREAVRRKTEGTLASTFVEAADQEEPWIDNDTGWDMYSAILFTYVGEAYDSFRKKLSDENRSRADSLMNALIWDGPFGHLQDLGEGLPGDLFAITIAPETAASLVELAAQIDFEEFKVAFENRCSAEIKETISRYETDVVSYVQDWVSVLEAASQRGRGVIISML